MPNIPKKKSFALRIDSELLDAVEKWAADEFRSTNGQLEWIIHEALKKAGRLKKNTPNVSTPKEDKTDEQDLSEK